ncbi:uncharacterized protein PODANS_4_5604 [Podospora anserina S mat+]|uniref:Podospora anserina S mat+ genomic DNA chromosome 4, supercontig 4 n=1 Tax=Podospora anserina (strain S / ATCC MYA-4624 / DSM 980 / FGSC 10383) TaxID=515849 RepID=B2AQ18_PODAN|nr:uncharacterized protein PODANS_4_5604 [Podospora anserina S mat+]CAP66957.1 unnamed protein product [Podospora anserina S mat+]
MTLVSMRPHRVALQTPKERQQQNAARQGNLDSQQGHQRLPHRSNEAETDAGAEGQAPKPRIGGSTNRANADARPRSANGKAPSPLPENEPAKRSRQDGPHSSFRGMEVAGGQVAAKLVLDEALSRHTAFGQPLMPGMDFNRESVELYSQQLVEHVVSNFDNQQHLDNEERAFTWGSIQSLMDLALREARVQGTMLTLLLQRGPLNAPHNVHEIGKISTQMHKTHSQAMKKFKAWQYDLPFPISGPSAQSSGATMSQSSTVAESQMRAATLMSSPASSASVNNPIGSGSQPSAVAPPQAQAMPRMSSRGSSVGLQTLTELGAALPTLQDVNNTASTRRQQGKVQSPARRSATYAQMQAFVQNGAQTQRGQMQPVESRMTVRQAMPQGNSLIQAPNEPRLDMARHGDTPSVMNTVRFKALATLRFMVKLSLRVMFKLSFGDTLSLSRRVTAILNFGYTDSLKLKARAILKLNATATIKLEATAIVNLSDTVRVKLKAAVKLKLHFPEEGRSREPFKTIRLNFPGWKLQATRRI